MTQDEFLLQQNELLERENRRLLEDLAGLRAHIQRLQQEAHERIQAAQRELQQERARGRQQLAEDRERVRVTYKAPERLETVMAALPVVTARVRWAITDGDQVDEERALKELERWVTSATGAFKEAH